MTGTTRMIQPARLNEIKDLLDRDGAVTVAQLAKGFNKTPITIRRDLHILEKEGFLKRTHGGAFALNTPGNLICSYDEREREHAKEKSVIAKKAAEYIQDGDSIILSAGTTMHELAIQLRRFKGLHVVTNGVTVVTELAHSRDAQVLMIGGEVDFKKFGTVGPLAVETMQHIHVSKAFLGVSGISIDQGISMHSPTEARINQCFLKSARETTVVVDSSKFEAHSLFRIAPLNEIHRIITDGNIEPETRRSLEKFGLELVVVEDQ